MTQSTTKTFRIIGYDAYGQPKAEEIIVNIPPPTIRAFIRELLGRFVFIGPFWNIGVRLGLHKFWRIKKITTGVGP